MKTKIIYISGNEIFNIADIRAAFEEVRNALQLDKETVLFGVPVDADDAGFSTKTELNTQLESNEISQEIEDTEPIVEAVEETEHIVVQEPEKPKQKRGRTRKRTEPESINTDQESDAMDEKVVPILSVLAGKEETFDDAPDVDNIVQEEAETSEIIEDDTNTEEDIITEIDDEPETENIGEPDLEKLLSAMTPLQEDSLEDKQIVEEEPEHTEAIQSEDVDATLEQLATEFAEAQDKIASETKSSTRSKIGKLRNILPFKQSKHKDQGLGDLFGWAGVAANDEDFSVPGFFTNATSKK